MSKYLNHTELIGAYLEGSMNPDEMLNFENQLHTDPVLRSEFELQQDIVNSLQNFRKSQLKARLDQVPVSVNPTTGLLGVKTAALIVLTGIIGIATYLLIDSSNNETIEPVVDQPALQMEDNIALDADENIMEDLEEVSDKAVEQVEELAEEEVRTAVARNPESSENTKIVAPAKNEEAPIEEASASIEEVKKEQPVVNSPQVIDPVFDETTSEENLEIPTVDLGKEEVADNPVVEIETAQEESTLFHYQYYSGKLYLYGDFTDNPYEILELNSALGKKLYLFHNGSYYQILDNQVDLTPLRTLEDQDIIEKLNVIKENK